LQRCRVLAELIGEPKIDARLKEMDFGRWEMRPWESIDRAELDRWRDDLVGWSVPGGESVGVVGARIASFLGDLAASGQGSACLVSHAGVIRILTCLLWGQDLSKALDFRIPFAGVVKVDWQPGRTRLLGLHGFDGISPPSWAT
jgi:alpha-ribazole phosphatase